MMKRYVITIIVVIMVTPLFLFEYVQAKTDAVIMQDDITHKHVRESLSFLKESNEILSIEDVMSKEMGNRFIKNSFPPNEIPNFGYVSNAYWAKFQIENNGGDNTFLFELAYPAIERFDLYIVREGVVVEEATFGAKFPFHEREFNHPNFLHAFSMAANEKLDIYIRMETNMSLQFPLYIHQQSSFYETKTKENLVQGITYGVLAVMALYNLFIYFSLRHISYLYYVFVIFATFLSNLAFTGVGFQYIWPYAPNWNAISAPFFLSVGMVAAILFAHNFLEIKKHLPKLHVYYILAFIFPLLTITLLLIPNPYALHIVLLGLMYQSLLIFLSASLLLIRGIRQARFFIIGWSVFLIGVILTMFSDAGIIPLTYMTKYAGQVGAMIEVVVLSFALADRINILQTEKRQTTRQLYLNQKATNDELLKIDKLKDEFLATTSHELRTPLNGIVGMTEMLQEGAGGPITPQMRHHLSLIQMSGKRLVSLINDILDYAQLKNETLKLEKKVLHMKEHVDLVIAICKPLLKDKNIRMLNLVDAEDGYVFADENRLQQILFNLIGNAIEHTEKGEIIITAEQKDGFLYVQVVDSGDGIPEKELPYIFEQFYQVNSEETTHGTGIGLSITKKLVELHDGSISITSVVGEGTTCMFSLPIATAHNEHILQEGVIHEQIKQVVNKPMMETIQPTEKQGDTKILIADDEMINLQVLIHQLSIEGYDVIYARDGLEVFDIIEREPIDLVILDIMMPKMSGLEVCKTLRKTYGLNDLPILMLTAKSQLHDKIIAFDAGANDYVVKPCERKELLARVKTLIHLRQTTEQLNEWNRALEKQVTARTEALHETNEQLQDALQSKQTLLRKVIHELGTPVTTVYSYVQAVEEGLMEANDGMYIEIIKEKVKLLMRLIDDLAHVSTLNESQFEYDKQAVRLDEITLKTARIFAFEVEHAKRNFTIQYDLEALARWYIHVDIGRMEQVFTNIIGNAIHYTEEEVGEVFVRVDVWQEEEKVCIIIQDNGIGVKNAELPLIFERFYKGDNWRAREEKGSSGLGLAIVKEIIEGHDGHVWAEDNEGNGLKIYILLPINKRKN